jgi:hypothetical protein
MDHPECAKTQQTIGCSGRHGLKGQEHGSFLEEEPSKPDQSGDDTM